MLRRCCLFRSAAPAVAASGKVGSIVVDPVPSPVEAPHLLESGALPEPKPFLKPQALKAFSVSLLIGAGFAASVYVLLSKSISDHHVEEQELLEQITKRHHRREHNADATRSIAESARQSLLDVSGSPFVAPSRFVDLKQRAEEAEAAARTASAPSALDTPMLHKEATYRIKRGWNDAISNVQTSLEAFDVEYRRRREASAIAAIKQLVHERGLDESTLRRMP